MIQTVLKSHKNLGQFFKWPSHNILTLVHLIQDEKKIWDNPIASLVSNESALRM